MARRTNDEWLAVLGGDLGQGAQEAAYEDLAQYLYKVIYNYLRSRSASVPALYDKSDDQLAKLGEDFTQSTLAKIALGQLYNRYQGKGRFVAYMAAVAINEVRQALRRKEWWVHIKPLPPSELEYEPESGDSLPAFEHTVSTDLGTENRQELQALWRTIHQCVQQLPERWRRAFIWKVYEDLSAAEVRERLRAESDQTVYNLVNRARGRLKKCLSASGWELDDIWLLFS
jgi:RNA polymerase sigma factor (sigma-70 family)